MTIIVTGGSGMVGRHLSEISPNFVYLSKSDCDLLDRDSVDKLFSFYKPKHVIHLAARVGGIMENISKPAEFYDQNITINTNVMASARKNKVDNLLSVLTTCIYPDVAKNYPLKEADIHLGPPAKANFGYAYAKRAMAVQIDAYNRQYGLNYNYLIPCNLYGEHDNFSESSKMHFVTALIDKIISSEKENKRNITLFGTGTPMRQFMYSGDLARIIKICVDNNITESFNVAPPQQNYSIDKMARIALETLGHSEWSISYDATKPDGQFRKDVCIEKMQKEIPNFEFTKFSEGIKRVYDKIKRGMN